MTTMANRLKEQFCNLVYLAKFSVQYISLKNSRGLLQSMSYHLPAGNENENKALRQDSRCQELLEFN
jgi:hypothetical protein